MSGGVRDALAGQADLADLPAGDLDVLVRCGQEVVVGDGELLGQEGAVADACFLVCSGRVGLEAHVPGAGSIRFLTVGPGELVGWSWLVPPHRWTADARAVGEVRAVALDGACLRRACAEDPALGERLALRMAQVVAERLAAARLQLLDLYAGRPDRAG